MLPTNSSIIFFSSFPFNGKIKEIKKKLNIVNIRNVSLLTEKKNQIRHEIITTVKNPKQKWVTLNLPFSGKAFFHLLNF